MNAIYAQSRERQRPEPAPAPVRRPRVCFLAPTTWPLLARSASIPVVGGAELQQAIVATALARRGYDVSMVSMDYGQPDGCERDGVRIHNMHAPDAGVRVIRFVHPRLTSLWKALKRADADVYYQRTAAVYTGYLAAFCKLHKRRSIHAGASDVDFIPGRQDIVFARDRWIYQYGVRNVDTVFAQNPSQQDNLRKHFGRDALIVPNCYEPPTGARADARGYVLWIATLRSQKRPEILIEIARRMPRQRFMLVGGSDSDARAQSYARAMREAAAALPNVQVRGFTPFEQADRLFDGARVVLNTSEYEGFPNTFLQAWARGVPTVAFVDTGSRHAGEAVYDVVPDVDAAVRAVGRLMDDDFAWERASRRVCEHFRARHSVASVVGLYESELQRLAGMPRA
jgi:glycosyltransferase involved in cell wall biosynthesis